jgi:hypothetical protein
MVRSKHVGSHDEAARRIVMSHPALLQRAQEEGRQQQAEEVASFDKGDGEFVAFRKGNVRVNKSAVANDAAQRLRTIIDRLKLSGMDGRQAEFRAKQANPELWENGDGSAGRCGKP